MFSFSKATLLTRKLLFNFILMQHLFAESSAVDYRNVLAYKGESVIFNCNISEVNVSQVTWNKDGVFLFAHSFILNQTQNNIISHRMSMDSILPTELKIFNVDDDDAGLYTCSLRTRKGGRSMTWNLSISEKTADFPSRQGFFLYLLIPVCVLLPLGITLTFCLVRKLKTRTQNLDSVRRQTVIYEEVPDEVREQVDLPQRQACTDHRKYQKHRSQYFEKLNFIYDSTELPNIRPE